MKHHNVTSSTIKSIGHDASTGNMEVTFSTGKTYSFGNVTAEQFEAFKNAPSAGKHFHQHFRGNPAHAVEVKS